MALVLFIKLKGLFGMMTCSRIDFRNYTSAVFILLLFFLWGCEGQVCDCEKEKDLLPSKKVTQRDHKEMVLIPSGGFIMGTNKVDTEGTHKKIGAVKPLYLDQHPERS